MDLTKSGVAPLLGMNHHTGAYHVQVDVHQTAMQRDTWEKAKPSSSQWRKMTGEVIEPRRVEAAYLFGEGHTRRLFVQTTGEIRAV